MADIRDFLAALREQAAGFQDAASVVGTSALLAPIKGLYGLEEAIRHGSLDAGANAIENFRGTGEEAKTDEGRAYLEGLGSAMEKGRKLAAPVLDPYEEWATKHPGLAASGEAVAGILPWGRAREAAMQGVKGATRAAAQAAKPVALSTAIALKDLGPIAGVPRRQGTTAMAKGERRGARATRDDLRADIEQATDDVAVAEAEKPLTKKAQREQERAQAQAQAQAQAEADQKAFEEADAAEAARLGVDPKTFGKAYEIREAGIQERLKRSQLAKDAGTVGRAKGAGTRTAKSPDVYRQMYEQQGMQPLLAAGEARAHLTPNPEGGFVGAPRHIMNYAGLQGLRSRMDADLAYSADILRKIDPERFTTWYDRAKAANAELMEPHQLDRGLEQTATYSAGVDPDSEYGFRVKHNNRVALGTDTVPYMRDPLNRLLEAMHQDAQADLGFKIGEYRSKNDPRVVEHKPFGVNDFRRARGMEYSDPEGNLTKAINETAHPFMDMETALQVARANANLLGGKGDWTGATLQEVPWIVQKGQDLFERQTKKYPRTTEGIKQATIDANDTIGDAFPKHEFSSTYETAPGKATGHRSDYFEMTPEERAAYDATGSWASEGPMVARDWDKPYVTIEPGPMQPKSPRRARLRGPDDPDAPYGTVKAGTVGAGDRDAFYRALEIAQRPTLEGEGIYTNRAGETEFNRQRIARPHVDFQTGTAQQINPHTQATLEAVERDRALMDAQEAAGGNLPVTASTRKGKLGLLLENMRRPTGDELADVMAGTEGRFDVTPTARGMHLMAKDYEYTPEQLAAHQQEALGNRDWLEAMFPGSKMTEAGKEGLFIPDATSSAEEAGQGIATGKLLDAYAKAPPEAALKVGESDEIRRMRMNRYKRDEGAPTTRPDIQKTRKFFAEEDWPKVVAYMRKTGKPAAAAMAALGFSLEGMAAENEPAR